jgi:hypothetical protein
VRLPGVRKVGEVAEWLKAHSAPLARVSPGRMRAPSWRAQGWRGGRVVEGARLESVYTGNRIAGSNPALSASSFSNASPLLSEGRSKGWSCGHFLTLATYSLIVLVRRALSLRPLFLWTSVLWAAKYGRLVE